MVRPIKVTGLRSGTSLNKVSITGVFSEIFETVQNNSFSEEASY